MTMPEEDGRKRKLMGLLSAGQLKQARQDSAGATSADTSGLPERPVHIRQPAAAGGSARAQHNLHASGGFYREDDGLRAAPARAAQVSAPQTVPALVHNCAPQYATATATARHEAATSFEVHEDLHLNDSDALLAVKTAIARCPIGAGDPTATKTPFTLLTHVQVRASLHANTARCSCVAEHVPRQQRCQKADARSSLWNSLPSPFKALNSSSMHLVQSLLFGQSSLDLDKELAALQKAHDVVLLRFPNSTEDVGIVLYSAFQQVCVACANTCVKLSSSVPNATSSNFRASRMMLPRHTVMQGSIDVRCCIVSLLCRRCLGALRLCARRSVATTRSLAAATAARGRSRL
jgi:hypothetical protein